MRGGLTAKIRRYSRSVQDGDLKNIRKPGWEVSSSIRKMIKRSRN